MKNNIQFISFEEVKQKGSFRWNIEKEIKKRIDKRETLRSDDAYQILLYAKYVIEKHKLNYSDIIEGKINSLMPYLKKKVTDYELETFIKYKLYEILKLFETHDYQIDIYQDRILESHIDEKKKYLLISSFQVPYMEYPNIDIYEEGCYAKETKCFSPNIMKYKRFDEICGIKRNYLYSKEQIAKHKYDEIIYLNDELYKPFSKLSISFQKVFMISKYSDISNGKSIKNGISEKELRENMQKIIIDKEKVYVIYNQKEKDETINIRLLTNVPTKQIKTKLEQRKPNENININIFPDEIIKNNYKIGFHIYQKNNEKKERKIIDMIGENKEIIQKISKLNQEIANQIDELVIKQNS